MPTATTSTLASSFPSSSFATNAARRYSAAPILDTAPQRRYSMPTAPAPLTTSQSYGSDLYGAPYTSSLVTYGGGSVYGNPFDHHRLPATSGAPSTTTVRHTSSVPPDTGYQYHSSYFTEPNVREFTTKTFDGNYYSSTMQQSQLYSPPLAPSLYANRGVSFGVPLETYGAPSINAARYTATASGFPLYRGAATNVQAAGGSDGRIYYPAMPEPVPAAAYHDALLGRRYIGAEYSSPADPGFAPSVSSSPFSLPSGLPSTMLIPGYSQPMPVMYQITPVLAYTPVMRTSVPSQHMPWCPHHAPPTSYANYVLYQPAAATSPPVTGATATTTAPMFDFGLADPAADQLTGVYVIDTSPPLTAAPKANTELD
jgi:hypothetical protein